MTPAAPSSPPARPRLLYWTVGAAVLLVYLGVAVFHVRNGAMNIDEGFYAAATRAVWQGEVPYRDFGFTQTPLVPYLNAPALRVLGFGLFEQRIVNGMWGLLALLLGGRLVARRLGGFWPVVWLGLFALLPAWMYFIHLGKTYGVTSFVAVSASVVFIDWRAGWRKTVTLSALTVIGIGCRLPSAPFFAVLWLAALFDDGCPTARSVLVACSSLAGAAALLLPFYLAAPEQSLFWTVEFHQISVPKKDWRLRWEDFVTLAPAVSGIMILAIGRTLAARQFRSRESVVVAASLVALATNLLPHGVYEEYGVPFLPPLALGGLLLLAPAVARWSTVRQTALVTGFLLASIAIVPLVNWHLLVPVQRTFPSWWLPRNARPYDFGLQQNLQRATAAVRKLLPAGAPFIGSNLILAVEADRAIPRRFRMGAFTMTSDYEPAEADRRHLMTYSEFESLLRDIDVTVVGLHGDPHFNFAWSVPSFGFQSDADRLKWMGLIRRYFVPVIQDGTFTVAARPFILPAAQRPPP